MKPKLIGYFNSNDSSALLGFGNRAQLKVSGNHSLSDIQQFIDVHQNEYVFVCCSYDLKNIIEDLESTNNDHVSFPTAFLWVPEYVVEFSGDNYFYKQGESCAESETFISDFLKSNEMESTKITLKPRIDKATYIQNVNTLLSEIQMGNIYEINYCQEFYADNVQIENPVQLYNKINAITKAPFSAYIAVDGIHVLCGSPERFMQKKGGHLISSPIKGTQKRGSTPEEDQQLKTDLKNDAKEQSENVMIVDLVRNDLSKVAKKNSVKVEELFGIYSFETVHQMISTISCKLREGITFSDILKALFPMGSMTGAPKIKAMELIEKHENFKRGMYSGTVGYIQPNGDFDFNVIIRTLLYNENKRYASCSVGGAITINSNPEKEYEECLIKLDSILRGINGSVN